MIKSAVTISLVDEARGGPFVFWDDFEAGCRKAAQLGFDAVELFAPGPDVLSQDAIRRTLEDHGLDLAAVGTGAGWVIHKWQLCDADSAVRRRARNFIESMIEYGAPFEAPAIVGSMQGRWGDPVDRPTALEYLSEGLAQLGEFARSRGVPLVYEPLNRYETNLVNTIAEGVALLEKSGDCNVKLLADLFHMNIEEADLAGAIRAGGDHIGHVHFVDSNRRPAGCGHMDYAPIAAALDEINFNGYASAEAFPFPDSDEAARLTIEAFRELVPRN